MQKNIMEFNDEVYFNVVVFSVGPFETVKDYVYQKYDLELEPDNRTCGAVFRHSGPEIHPNRFIYVVWAHDINDMSTVLHELFHLTCYVMSDSGITLQGEQSEPGAYYMEYAFRKWMQFARETEPVT